MAILPRKPKCYAIVNWWKHFEISQGKRAKRLSWVPFPNKMDGKGFRRLSRHEANQDGSVFAAFVLMVEIASKQPVRGILEDEDGPLSTEDLSDQSGYPMGFFDCALPILTNPHIGWMCEVTEGLRAEYTTNQSSIGVHSERTPSANGAHSTTGNTIPTSTTGGREATPPFESSNMRIFPREMQGIKEAKEEQRQELMNRFGLEHEQNRERYPDKWEKCRALRLEIKSIRDKMAAIPLL